MITMNFPVKSLAETLEKNRNTHAQNYEQMKKDYREAYTNILKEKLAVLNDTGKKPPAQHIDLAEPFNYLDSYDDVLSMLKATNDETIPLTSDQYKCYARDKWPQKSRFDAVTGSYGLHKSR